MKDFVFFLEDISSSLLGHLIIWYQFGIKYGHAGIVLNYYSKDFDPNNPYVVEAQNKIVKHFIHKPGKLRYFRVTMTDNQYNKVMQVINEYVNTGYDVTGLLSFIFRINLSNPKKLFCSEFVVEVLKEVGVDLFRQGTYEPWQICPSQLMTSTIVEEIKF